MESVLKIVFSAENIRMLVLLVFGFGCYVMMNSRMDKRIDGVELSLNKRMDGIELSLNKRIDGVEKRMDGIELSLNKRMDNVNNAIEALTFTLEKNGILKPTDKAYVDRRLAN